MQRPYRSFDCKKMLLEMVEQQTSSEQKEIFAYHEAGHAVAAVLLGESISRVSLCPDVRPGGEIVFGTVETRDAPGRLNDAGKLRYEDLTPQEKEALEHNVIVSMAGEILVRKVFAGQELRGFQEDRSHVAEVAEWMFESPDDREQYCASLSNKVGEMFERKEALCAVEVFVKTLLVKTEISGEEAMRIIGEAIANPPE